MYIFAYFYKVKLLTSIEYAVPNAKLMKRAQNNGHEPTIHERAKL